MWSAVVNAVGEYGIAAIIAAVLLWILYKILSNFMSSLKEDRDNYMKIIEQQTVTQNNHIQHLDEAVKTQSNLITQQGERFTAGINKLCDALQSQTEVLKTHIKSSKRG